MGGAQIARVWRVARSGDFRGGADAARKMLAKMPHDAVAERRVELHLVVAFCAMRQGHLGEAARELDAASHVTSGAPGSSATLRVEAWRAELAYFQGRYSAALELVQQLLGPLELAGDLAYVAFVIRIQIAVLLARADYGAIKALSDRAITAAKRSRDDYVLVQVLNILGATAFDRATAKLPEPHARAHLSSLDPRDAQPMEDDARDALQLFERAGAVAKRAKYEFAAWYVAGNIERLQILLGHADQAVKQIGKRLTILQSRGATYDEIVARSNLAWAMRTLGRHGEALHELDVALDLARESGTFNVLLEFLHYDRSIVLDALGDSVSARVSYRRYLALIGGRSSRSAEIGTGMPSSGKKRPLEPYFLKRADRFIADQIHQGLSVEELAQHCGVSWRTLEKAFIDFRGVTPVAHMRNVRLDRARREFETSGAPVAEVARQCGFGSTTTFALEYRRRFGMAPSRARHSTAPTRKSAKA